MFSLRNCHESLVSPSARFRLRPPGSVSDSVSVEIAYALMTKRSLPISPWVKWLVTVTLVSVAIVSIGAGTLGVGSAWLAFAAYWLFISTERMRRARGAVERAGSDVGEVVGQGLAKIISAAIDIGTPIIMLAAALGGLYLLVRFVKWAWMND